MARTGSGKVILINGNTLLRRQHKELIAELKSSEGFSVYTNGEVLVAATIPFGEFGGLIDVIAQLHISGESAKIIAAARRHQVVQVETITHIWDIVHKNPSLINSDFDEYYAEHSPPEMLGDAHIYGTVQMIAAGQISGQFASVLDTRSGPIILGTGTEIKTFSCIEGPAFIGNGCRITGGNITGGCSFGDGCRIGGEVENSIMVANSNKYHQGFLGHAYIGEWVNLGAMTTNSDLKNNYSEVSVKQDGAVSNTRQVKVGCFIGDHSKTGIGTMLNTGVTVGFSCNLFGGNLIVEKEIPSFAWGNDLLRHEYSLGKALETARVVMHRRGQLSDDRQQRLFEYLFAATASLRKSWLSGTRH